MMSNTGAYRLARRLAELKARDPKKYDEDEQETEQAVREVEAKREALRKAGMSEKELEELEATRGLE